MFNKFTTAGISHPAQGSAEFDGSGDYIQLDTPFSYTNHTIAAWLYHPDVDSFDRLFDNRTSGTDTGGISIYLSSATDKTQYTTGGSTVSQSGDAILNQWYFATFTYDGATQKIYINGSLDNSKSYATTINATQNARIGSNGWIEANFWEGNLANVAIWNRALSSDEINSVMWKPYQALTTTEQSGLQAWYSLDDISSPAASLATMEALAVDKDATIENKAAITAAINALS